MENIIMDETIESISVCSSNANFDLLYSPRVASGGIDQSEHDADRGSDADASPMISNTGAILRKFANDDDADYNFHDAVEGGEQFLNTSIDTASKFDPFNLKSSNIDPSNNNNNNNIEPYSPSIADYTYPSNDYTFNTNMDISNDNRNSPVGSLNQETTDDVMMDHRKLDSPDSATVDMMDSPTKSVEGLSPQDVAADQQKRQKALCCKILVGLFFVMLAIGVPLGIRYGVTNNRNPDSSNLDSSSQQTIGGDDTSETATGGSIFGSNDSTIFVDLPNSTSSQGDVPPEEQESIPTSSAPPETDATGTPFESFSDLFTLTTAPVVTPAEDLTNVTNFTNPSDIDLDETADQAMENAVTIADVILPILLTVTQEATLLDSTLPQGRAYQWLTTVDQTIPTNLDLLPQRYVLAALDFSVHNNTNHNNTNHNNASHAATTFFANADSHECLWEGITCNEQGQVTAIHWSNANLQGQLIPELRYLPDTLNTLDLAENELTGRLDDLWHLQNLQYVYMHDNQFSGSIAPMVGQLNNLERLYLSHNQLTGSLPFSLSSSGGGGSKPLRYLVLNDNRLSGTIPENFRLRSLFYFDLGYNRFSGSIPGDWDTNLVSIRHLWLDHNEFTGEMPESFGTLGRGRLKQMYLNNNNLSGDVIRNWRYETRFLSNIDLSRNDFSGRLDGSLCRLSVFIEGEMVELRADCDICSCDTLCETQCKP